MARVIAISLLATDRMSRTFDRAAGSVNRLNGAMERVDKVGKFSSLAVGAAAALSLTRALVPLAAAAIALPSALTSLKVATLTAKVGMQGMGEAMKQVASGDAKKLDAALKGLAPNARAFVKETQSLNKEWKKTQQAVQNRMFAGLDQELKGVAKNLLPTVSKGMKMVAGDLNGVGTALADTMKSDWFKGRVAQVFSNTSRAVNIMTGGIRPLIDILSRLAVLGGPLVEQFASWAVNGLKAAAAWAQNANNAKKLTGAFSGVGATMSKVGNIVRNLVVFLAGLLGATKEFDTGAGNMLDTLNKATAAMAAWSQSAEGQKKMGDIFKTLGDVLHQVSLILPILGGTVTMVFKALNSLPGPVRDTAVQMITWSLTISIIIGRLKLLGAVIGTFKMAKGAFDAVGKGIKGVQTAATATKGFVAGFRNVNTAFSSSATRANILGAAIKSQLMRWKQLTMQMYASAKSSVVNAASWVRLKAVAAGNWIMTQVRSLQAWVVAQYNSARAAVANAIAQARQKAAAAGGWIMAQVTALRSLAVAQFQTARAATASAVASARQKIAIIATAVAQKVAAVASRAWAAAQWLLNAALTANPIGLIIVAIVALGAAFVLAYKKVGWFRTMVNTIFEWLKAAVVFVINFVKSHWQLIIAVMLGPLGIILGLVIKYWSQIKNFVMTAVNAVINFVRNHWKLIVAIIAGPLGIVIGLVIRYWGQIKSAISAALNFIVGLIRAQFNLMRAVIGAVLSVIHSVVVGGWNRIRSATVSVWNAIRGHISSVLGGIRNGFSSAVSAIGGIWDRLRDAARKPVNFVIGIYNNGIRGLVSSLSGLVGHKIDLPKLNTFATGGVMPGYAPGKDSLMAMVSPGESIFRPEFTRAVGGGWVKTANDLARRGGAKAVQKWLAGGGDNLGMEGAAYARGGVVRGGFAGGFDLGGIVGGLVKGLKNFSILDPMKAAKGALDKIVGGSVPGGGMIRDLVAKFPGWIKDKVWGWIKSKLDFFSGGGGGPIGAGGFARALQFAKAQSGKPYVWGGVGPGGYDCSGFMSAITNVIKGRNPYSRLFTTFSFSGARSGPQGFVRNAVSPFRVGVTNAGVGHMAGTLNGVNVESNGSQGVHYGPGARGANNSLFGMQYGLRADTGALALRPGWNPPVFNGTGRMEYLSTPAAAGGSTYNLTVMVDPASGVHPADVGEAIVKRIKDYEKARGKGWRSN